MRADIKLIEAALNKLENGTPPLNLDATLLPRASYLLMEIICDVETISKFLLAVTTAVTDYQQEPR